MDEEKKQFDTKKWDRFSKFLRWFFVALAILIGCIIKDVFFDGSFLIGLVIVVVLAIAFAYLDGIIKNYVMKTPSLRRKFDKKEDDENSKPQILR